MKRTRIIISSAPVASSLPSGLKHTLLMYRSSVLSAKVLGDNNSEH